MPRSAKAPNPAASPPPEPLDSAALVPVRARTDGWTPQRQRAFIEVLADTGSVSAAAEAVGLSREAATIREHVTTGC